VSLNTKKDEALDEKFLSSFVLPERVDRPANTATANTEGTPNTPSDPNAASQTQGVRKEGTPAEGGTTPVTTVSEDNTESGVANVPNATANQGTNQQGQQNQKRAPIAGGMLNGKAIYMPSPEAPGGEANGVVIVQILVDEQGAVVDARAVAGPPALHGAAVNAARLARFNPTFMMGEAVRVSGTLSYNFVRSN
jgi:outer membrane biosynthesis protein TonB